jgi:hypothetical protein
MDRFLKVAGSILALLFFLAVIAGIYAGLAWIIKAVWQA